MPKYCQKSLPKVRFLHPILQVLAVQATGEAQEGACYKRHVKCLIEN